MSKKFIIGIGNRARQGKDTIANFIKELRSNDDVQIVHWADSLYDEVRNKDRKLPLIKKTRINGIIYYNLLDDAFWRRYILYTAEEMPGIHQFMINKNVDEYWGMDEKDSIILQLWGTNFRRHKIDVNYWVNKTFNKINELLKDSSDDKNLYICIPDTRFLNEYLYITQRDFSDTTEWEGIFIRVLRLNEDGTQFIDSSRDPHHTSEVELDGAPAMYTLTATSGDLFSLREQTREFLHKID